MGHPMLRLFAAVAKKRILEEYRPDCCIAAAKITIKVFNHFGVDGVPLMVNTYIFNKAYAEAVERGDDPPKEKNVALFDEWLAKHKAWAIGLGVPHEDRPVKGWGSGAGHVVVVQPEYNDIIDVTLDQANRPEHDIFLPPFFAGSYLPGFPEGREPAWYYVNGNMIQYIARPDDKSYLTSPDWQLKFRTRPIVKAIISDIYKLAGKDK
jgi:hypothetical protein